MAGHLAGIVAAAQPPGPSDGEARLVAQAPRRLPTRVVGRAGEWTGEE